MKKLPKGISGEQVLFAIGFIAMVVGVGLTIACETYPCLDFFR